MTNSRGARAERVGLALTRQVRRLPALEGLVGRAAVRLRSSMTARKAVSRVFDVDVTGLGGTVFLSAGNLLDGLGLDNLPVIVISLVGADPTDVPKILERIAQEQVLTGGFRPVILLDSDQFVEVRQYGYPVELIIPESEWGDASWRSYFGERLRALRRGYQASSLLEIRSPDDVGLEFLASLGTSE